MRIALALGLLLTAQATPARLVYQGAASVRAVALTFDAGADRGYALRILKTLETSHLHATFGMTGRWARANPDLVKRMARDRDTFINHTFDHRSFTGFSSKTAALSNAQRTWEITQTEKIIRRMTGMTTKPYFRPPYGDLDNATLALATRLGYPQVVMWTVDSLGWNHLPKADIVRRCLSMAKPGAIFLMHVGIQSQDALALPAVISGLRHSGYRIVTVPKLLRGH